MGPYKNKKEALAAFKKRQDKAIELKTKQFRDKKIEFDNHAKEINNFVKNFYDENITKYGLRDYDSFEKALLKAFKESGIKDISGRNSLAYGFPNVGKHGYGKGKSQKASKSPLTLFNIKSRIPSGVSTLTDAQAFFKKAFFAGQLDQNPQLLKDLKRYLDYYNIDKKFYKGVGFSRLDLKKQYADVLDPSVKADLLYLLESEDIGGGKLRGGYLKAFLPEEYEAYQKKKNNANLRYQKILKQIESSMPKKALKEALDGDTSIKRYMNKQTSLLNKIFDTSALKNAGYPELIFNADHLEGVAEIVKFKNVNDKIRALKNMVGTTAQKNYELGMFGFSKNRQDLISKINKGTNVDKNLKKLNEITKTAYPQFEGNLYKYDASTKSVKPTKNFIVEYKPEVAFKQYFEELFNNSVGRKELLKQSKNNPELAKIVSQLKSNNAGMYSFPAQLERISLPPSVVKALSSVGKIVKGAGVVSGFAEPVFAAYNFSEAIDKGASLGQSGDYVVNKFVEDVVNIPGVVYGGGKYLKDKFLGKDAKFELPYEATFARDKLQKTIDQTDPEIIKARLAKRDFDTQVLPSLTMVDDIDIPASKEEIDKAKDVFMKEKDVDLSVLDKPKKSTFGKYNEQIKDLLV
jgi:hypothetical protein